MAACSDARLGDVPTVVGRVVLGQDQVVEDSLVQPVEHGPVYRVVTPAALTVILVDRIGDLRPQCLPLGVLFRVRLAEAGLVLEIRQAEHAAAVRGPVVLLFLG